MRFQFFLACLSVVATATPVLGSGISEVGEYSSDSVPSIERVSFTQRSDHSGWVVRLHATGNIQAFSVPKLESPNTYQVTLFKTKVRARPVLETPTGPVRSYRIDEVKGNVLFKLIVREASDIPQIYRDRDSHDLLITLTRSSPESTPPASAPTNATDSSGSTSNKWKIDTIVIDAGHGGKDTGAIGYRGMQEKNLVLAVAKKVGRYLEEKTDVKVVYTRSDDRFIALKDRGSIANDAGGKLFISIHANAARDRRAHGTETYFLGMHKTDAARKVMNRENEVIRFESDQNHYDGFDTSGLVEQVLAQSVNMRRSERLAGLIEKDFATRVRRSSRSVKQAGFYVLWNAAMPAVLVELGFVTNRDEGRFLSSKNGQTYMASAIFRAIRDYKDEYEAALRMASR